MNDKFLEQMKNTLGNLNNVNPERMQELLKGTLEMLQELQENLKSNDPKKQKEAQESALKIKEELGSYTEKFLQEKGMTLNEVIEQAKNNPNIQQASEIMKTEMAKMEVNLTTPPDDHAPKNISKHKINPIRI